MQLSYTQKKQNTFYLICGILMLTSEIWKQLSLTFLLNDGNYIWWYFPFQLCSIPMYLCLMIPWITYTPLRSTFLAFLMDFGLLGGFFAFFDTSGMHCGYAPLTIHSYLWHILLVFIGLYTGYTFIQNTVENYFRKATFLYLLCCIIATIFNVIFYQYGTINMFYISPHYIMQQKVFRSIARIFGNPTGITIYILSTIFGAWVINLFWKLWGIHHFKMQKKGTGDF